jgi:hypothetical protein
MTRSIAVAALLAAVSACAQPPVEPAPPVALVNPATAGFEAYCGPIWSVYRQGYQYIPCPPGSRYPGAQ